MEIEESHKKEEIVIQTMTENYIGPESEKAETILATNLQFFNSNNKLLFFFSIIYNCWDWASFSQA